MPAKKEHKIINEVECKECPGCKQWLPATKEYFYTTKYSSADGFASRCKACAKLNYDKNKDKRKQYYKENREKFLARHKRYYAKNKDKKKEYWQIYEQENKEKIAVRKKKYRQLHKSESDEYRKKYRAKNWDKFYEKNREKIILKVAEYRKTHKEEHNIYNHRRRAKAKQLLNSLTNEQWEKIKQYFDNKCCYCGKELPLQQEHFVPLSKGGEYTINNIICACASCNASKQGKNFFEWYPKNKHFSKKREKKILEYLNYSKNNIQQLSIL